jgi:4-alpha-glucanotransferase
VIEQPLAPSSLVSPARRCAGILLHPTSLPSRHGVGDLGLGAHAFLEWLASTGQSVWQVLPLGPTGYGDSPYQALSAFAGNHLLLSPELMVEEGLLEESDLADAPTFGGAWCDYQGAQVWKRKLIARAAHRLAGAPGSLRRQLEELLASCPQIGEYALYAALKERAGGQPWFAWPARLAQREPAALEAARRELESEVQAHLLAQWIFHRQWTRLRAHAHALGIQIVGDLPMYLAHDSADVWSRRELFLLDPQGRPLVVSGFPPDCFSATGQLWGTPIYDWKVHQEEQFQFWVDRMQHNLNLYDRVRLDHFRGYEAYWAVPAQDATAEHGQWIPGPGALLFEALERRLGRLPIIAENMGFITPPVERLRQKSGWPGMAILQWAFGDDPMAPSYKPHNYQPDLVAYTGTHDHDTVLGWWNRSSEGSDLAAQERRAAIEYFRVGPQDEMNWVMIQSLYASVASTVITPLQDLLGLDNRARMNAPGAGQRQWCWRFEASALTPALGARLRRMAEIYDRLAPPALRP